MPLVVEVKFKKANKFYYFDPADLPVESGRGVIVETSRGMELGEAVNAPHEVPDSLIVPPLKPIIRMATAEDFRQDEENERLQISAMDQCRAKIEEHKLDMHLVDAEYTFDRSKVIFYFTADGRIDFRELVKDLASVFHTRIELRQIGVRDEAKMLGGLGMCGRVLCCKQFLADFQPVSIKMAKEQNLSLNPTKISGICGRLMCCLKYEQSSYEEALRKLPRVGTSVRTPDGIGTVEEVNPLLETVKAKILLQDGTFDLRDYYADEIEKAEPSAQ